MQRVRITAVDPDAGELVGTTTFSFTDEPKGRHRFEVDFASAQLPVGIDLELVVRVTPGEGGAAGRAENEDQEQNDE